MFLGIEIESLMVSLLIIYLISMQKLLKHRNVNTPVNIICILRRRCLLNQLPVKLSVNLTITR